ncbi:hypothetical protein [Dysgonomonas sp.]
MKDFLSLLVESYLQTSEKPNKKKSSRSKKTDAEKQKTYKFNRVNAKYESMLNNQLFGNMSEIESKRKVIEHCISTTEGYNRIVYLARLRDTMMTFVLDLSFLMECRDLNLSPFSVAQNMVILYKHKKAQESGIKETFNNDFELLKEPLFTEAELAEAKFSNVEGYATTAQKTQLSLLIERAMKILPDPKDKSKEDSNELK